MGLQLKKQVREGDNSRYRFTAEINPAESRKYPLLGIKDLLFGIVSRWKSGKNHKHTIILPLQFNATSVTISTGLRQLQYPIPYQKRNFQKRNETLLSNNDNKYLQQPGTTEKAMCKYRVKQRRLFNLQDPPGGTNAERTYRERLSNNYSVCYCERLIVTRCLCKRGGTADDVIVELNGSQLRRRNTINLHKHIHKTHDTILSV